MITLTAMAIGFEIFFLLVIGIYTFGDNKDDIEEADESLLNIQKLFVVTQGFLYYPNLFTFATLEIAWKARIKEQAKTAKQGKETKVSNR